MNMKPGSRWKSSVCTAEVVVVKPPANGGELCCGGVPMLDAKAERPEGATPLADQCGGTLLGKRYGNADLGIEVLCTKAGQGSLSLGGQALELIEAKRLPSSD